jgi:hypothetical protein
MKTAVAVLFLAASLAAGNAALAATGDEAKWINACVKDNRGEADDAVIVKYCTCMNNKMDSNDTQSITQWEKTHVIEREACDRVAGWK